MRYPKPKSEFIRVERIDSQMRRAARAAQSSSGASKDPDFKLVLAQPMNLENKANGVAAHYVLKSYINVDGEKTEKNKEKFSLGKT
jgi:hypothetical protein